MAAVSLLALLHDCHLNAVCDFNGHAFNINAPDLRAHYAVSLIPTYTTVIR